MIRFMSFCILNSVKSSCFFIFFLRDYLGRVTQVICPSKLDLLYIGLSLSHDPSHEFDSLTQLTQFFLKLF